MNYKEILTVIEEINLNRLGGPKRITPANWKLVDKIFSLGKQVEPCDAYRNGEDRVFW